MREKWFTQEKLFKLVSILSLVLCLFLVSGCEKAQSLLISVLGETLDRTGYNKDKVANKLEKYKDVINKQKPTAEEMNGYVMYYALDKKLSIENFYVRRTTLQDNFAKLKKDKNTKVYNLHRESNFFSPDQYVITKNPEEAQYMGEIKDNMPDGFGAILAGEKLLYMGGFDKGLKSGFGILFNPLVNGLIYYEGYFAKDKLEGKGNGYIVNNLKDITYTSGDYKDDKMNGAVIVYHNDMLIYKGGMVKGNKEGNGTLYFYDTGKKQYEGGFKDDKYEGVGTLYDKNGKEVYSGKWKNGDYAH